MVRKHQSGNIAWKVALWKVRLKPGHVGRRLCAHIKRDGNRCKGLAVNDCKNCYQHGGSFVVYRRNLKKAPKLRYAAWTERSATSNARKD